MKKFSKIMLALTLAVSTTVLGACGTKKDTKTATVNSVDPKKVSGEVNFAVYNWGVADYTKMVEKFNEVYPNVKVNIVGFDGNLNDYLTAQASSGTLPDVVFGWENLNYPISQGWVAPIDKYLAADPDSKNIPKAVMSSYKFDGKTYAVPTNLQFSTILVNLDLVDQLNMDPPTYDWTIDQFKDYLTKATTDKTSGINHLWAFEDPMTAMMSGTLGEKGYDDKTGKFNFTDGSWVKAINFQKELKGVPGLVSDDLKNQKLRDAGKEDDYQKKFGKDADALRESKVLFGFHGTWDYSWIKTMNYKFDFYPIPQDPSVGYREGMHADHAFMMSTAKAPQAAYELLKWFSYGKDGVLSRMDYWKNYVDADGKPAPDFFIPATTQKDVLSNFDALDFVPEGIKYMLKHTDKAYRADHYKFVPDFDKVENDIVTPQSEDIRAGKADASAVAAELEKKANDALAEAKTTFENQLKANAKK